jgi:phosphoribulokinase
VPSINVEWIQKLHHDKVVRGQTHEAVVDTILQRMPDYVNYICPQISETHVNFQRVPVVDTSNPFANFQSVAAVEVVIQAGSHHSEFFLLLQHENSSPATRCLSSEPKS